MRKYLTILILTTLLLAILLFPFRATIYKDGGTKRFTSLLCTVISWNEIEGKHGIEVYFFPNNFHDINYYKTPQ